MREQFTLEKAFEMQELHLKQWETILKPEVYVKLRGLVTADNDKVTDPYEVCRGSSIDHFVHNPGYYLLF